MLAFLFTCLLPRLIRIPVIAALVFALTVLMIDVAACSAYDGTAEQASCFVQRTTLDVADVYHGRSIERFVLPIVLASVYVLLEVSIWLITRQFQYSRLPV